MVHRGRQIQDLGWTDQEYSRGGPPLWEALPGQSPQRTLAEEVGVILVKTVVTPEVSPQAVDQLPVTSTKPHWVCTSQEIECEVNLPDCKGAKAG